MQHRISLWGLNRHWWQPSLLFAFLQLLPTPLSNGSHWQVERWLLSTAKAAKKIHQKEPIGFSLRTSPLRVRFIVRILEARAHWLKQQIHCVKDFFALCADLTSTNILPGDPFVSQLSNHHDVLSHKLLVITKKYSEHSLSQALLECGALNCHRVNAEKEKGLQMIFGGRGCGLGQSLKIRSLWNGIGIVNSGMSYVMSRIGFFVYHAIWLTEGFR